MILGGCCYEQNLAYICDNTLTYFYRCLEMYSGWHYSLGIELFSLSCKGCWNKWLQWNCILDEIKLKPAILNHLWDWHLWSMTLTLKSSGSFHVSFKKNQIVLMAFKWMDTGQIWEVSLFAKEFDYLTVSSWSSTIPALNLHSSHFVPPIIFFSYSLSSLNQIFLWLIANKNW